MGIDPVTHKPFSLFMAEIATTLAPPDVANLAEAALGCFKDEMLHLLTKKPIHFQFQHSNATPRNRTASYINSKQEERDDTIEKIKISLSRAMQEPDTLHSQKSWDPTEATSANLAGNCKAFPMHSVSGFQYGLSSFRNEGRGSPWSQSMSTGSTSTGADQRGHMHDKLDGGKHMRNGSNIFNIASCGIYHLTIQ